MTEAMAADMAELPVFAGDEAKTIFSKIQKKKERLEIAEKAYVENVERIRVMEDHLKNVRQEVVHTTGLLGAKEKAIKSEEHAAEMSKREAGRYGQELKREQSEIEKQESVLNNIQNQVFEANEKMDQFKLQMNWNQEELEQWAVAAKQKEEDNAALERYKRADESKIHALTLHIEKLTSTELEKRVALENERTETAARQVELDRTAQEFRTLHAERQQLMTQWKDAIDAVRRRDTDITTVANQYLEEKARKETQMKALLAAREEVEKRRERQAEVEAEILLAERQVQLRRDELAQQKENILGINDEIEILKTELAASARALTRKKQENERNAEQIAARKAHLEKCRKQYKESKQKLDSGESTYVQAEKTAAQAEDELRVAQNEAKKREKQVATIKENTFKESQALYALRQEESNYIADISGAQAQARNLQSKIRQLDSESLRQRELVYNADFQIQQMERKVARGMGERSDAEKQQLNKEIKQIEAALEAERDHRKMLNSQCRTLSIELRAARRRAETIAQEQKDMEARITQLDLENTSAEQNVKVQTNLEEDTMLQNDVMRLELKRLRDALTARADKVFTLENRKQQLKLSILQRKKEIAVHKDVQSAQLRLAEEERHKTQLDVGQRKHHVQKLAAKYETICKSSKLRQAGDTDGEEPKSQAFYLIQAAQKREELQRQGDELDQQIRRREREMRALEATLNHVNTQYSTFRQSFQKANMQSSEAEDLHQLEEQSKLATDALFRRKKELQRLTADFDLDERRLEQVNNQCARLEERNANLLEASKQMQIELEAQDETLAKASQRLNRLSFMHREKLGKSNETVQEKAFRADGLFEANHSVVDTLKELGTAYPEVRDILTTMIAASGLDRIGVPPAQQGK